MSDYSGGDTELQGSQQHEDANRFSSLKLASQDNLREHFTGVPKKAKPSPTEDLLFLSGGHLKQIPIELLTQADLYDDGKTIHGAIDRTRLAANDLLRENPLIEIVEPSVRSNFNGKNTAPLRDVLFYELYSELNQGTLPSSLQAIVDLYQDLNKVSPGSNEERRINDQIILHQNLSNKKLPQVHAMDGFITEAQEIEGFTPSDKFIKLQNLVKNLLVLESGFNGEPVQLPTTGELTEQKVWKRNSSA